MRFQRLLFMLMGVCGLVVGVWALATSQTKSPDNVLIAPPSVECPQEIDLGVVEVSKFAEGVIPIKNSGGQPVTLSHFASNCGCLSPQLLPKRTELTSPTTVTIQPNEVVRIAVTVRVSGAHGVRTNHTLRFQTDIPDLPVVNVKVHFTPTASLFSDPAMLSLGEVGNGDTQVAVIQVYSTDSQAPPVIRSVTSLHPEQLQVRFEPETGAEVVSADSVSGSRRIGRVFANISGLKTGDLLNSQIDIYTDQKTDSSLSIGVSAKRIEKIQLTPTTLYLPRTSGTGSVYSGIVQCRSVGTGLNLKLDKAPPGLSVQLSPASAGFVRVTVTADPKLVVRESIVTFTAQCDGKPVELSLRVVVTELP